MSSTKRLEKYNEPGALADLTAQPWQELTCIGAKAFLSNKEVTKLVLPDTLDTMEDWAFAHMKNLQEIVFPAKDLSFGKKVFLDCGSLQKVFVRGADLPEGTEYLLANLYRAFPTQAPTDLSIFSNPESLHQWFSGYDRLLIDFLQSPDDRDFTPAFIGWFQDEDVDDQRLLHIHNTKLQKLTYCLQRLDYASHLSADTQNALYDYLSKETNLILEALQSGTFPQINALSFYKHWKACTALTADLAARLLEYEGITDAEVRSFLIDLTLTTTKSAAYFDQLEL